MGPTFRLAAFVSAFALFSPASAGASSILIGESQSWSYDGAAGGCSTCQATVLFELLSGTSLRISFENTSTDWLAGMNILTGIGFDSSSGLSDIAIASQDIEGGKVWKLTGGIGSGSWEVALASNNGINNGLDNQSDLYDSGWVILGWDSPVISLAGLTIESSVVKFLAAAPNGGAIHAAGVPSGATVQTTEPVSVPEPSSLLLLAATGVMLARRYRERFARTGPRPVI